MKREDCLREITRACLARIEISNRNLEKLAAVFFPLKFLKIGQIWRERQKTFPAATGEKCFVFPQGVECLLDSMLP